MTQSKFRLYCIGLAIMLLPNCGSDPALSYDPTVKVSKIAGPDADMRYAVTLETFDSKNALVLTQTVTFQAVVGGTPTNMGALTATNGELTAFPSLSTAAVDTLNIEYSMSGTEAGSASMSIAAVPVVRGTVANTSDLKLNGSGTMSIQGITSTVSFTNVTIDVRPGDGDGTGCDTAYPCSGTLKWEMPSGSQASYSLDGSTAKVANHYAVFNGQSNPLLAFNLTYRQERDMTSGQKAKIIKAMADANKPVETPAQKGARDNFNRNATHQFLKSLSWFYWKGSWTALKYVHTLGTAALLDVAKDVGKELAQGQVQALLQTHEIEKQSFKDESGSAIDIVCDRTAKTGSATASGTYTRKTSPDATYCSQGTYRMTCTFVVDADCNVQISPGPVCVTEAPVGSETTITCPSCGVDYVDLTRELSYLQRPSTCCLYDKFNEMGSGVTLK